MKSDYINRQDINILIVDDQPNNLRLLSSLLTDYGYKVRKAINGKMAIASVTAEVPDLILLDIRMPDMDGYEVCEALKANSQTSEVPIIFISALDEVWDKVKAFSIGAVDYITKPFQSEEVLARVDNHLHLQYLQRKLKEQNEQLTRSNRELEQFAYVVSHDLQQPLQSIIGFAKVINHAYHDEIPPTAQDYLERIEKAGYRMHNFIQDLLNYSRVDKQEQLFEQVDCNLILQQICENLHQVILEKKVQITIDALPTVQGNPLLLLQLWQNLVSNAIKFVSPDVAPQVYISAMWGNQEWQFCIRDNGIGIPKEFHKNIFEVFQRLHTTQDYPGTGIGLATCQKIVKLHGGQIWLESQEGKGTTFYFTLPKH